MRYDLTDFEWSVIEPLLPSKRRGVKPKRNRRVLNGIFWSCEPARPGGISLIDMGLTQPATIALIAGAKPAFGIA
jgi:transposase